MKETIKTRPKKVVDWKKVDELLIAGCLGTEIAAHFDMHHDTFYRKVEEHYGIGFTAYSAEKKAIGVSCIRKAQYDKAVNDKDNTMLIWLGKIRAGQREEAQDLQPKNDDLIAVQQENMTLQNRLAKAEKLLEAYGHKPETESELLRSDTSI